jgi:hypothetical protein
VRAGAFAALVLACAIAGSARAHDTFLWPARFEQARVGDVPFALSSTAAFPQLETGPEADRVAAMTQGLSVVAHEERALRLMLANPRRGLNVAAIALHPRDIELQAAETAHYFEEIGVSDAARAAYQALAEPRVLRETYTKYAKTIFCVTACQGYALAIARVGHALEFVAFAERDGVTLRRFVLYANGGPAIEQAVAATTADGRRRTLRTNNMGIVDLPDDVRGPTLLSAVILRPPAAPDARFTSDFATLTFVAP